LLCNASWVASHIGKAATQFVRLQSSALNSSALYGLGKLLVPAGDLKMSQSRARVCSVYCCRDLL
jgi:hypothetical protein